MDTFVGFDSAWVDKLKSPGAVCAVTFANNVPIRFHPPQLASFDQALAFIRKVSSGSKFLLVALDQPTIVPNLTSMRPVDRVAASLVSWLGGGVQPANRSRTGMFCDASPIWKFLKALGALDDPEQAQSAHEGRYLMEVFPALALASLAAESFGRLKGLRYNPARKKTFRHADWITVAEAATVKARTLGLNELAQWCDGAAGIAHPRKDDQDRLDSALCLLIALHWQRRPRRESIMLGDLSRGYMVLPASLDVRERLTVAAQKYSVSLDASLPENPSGGWPGQFRL
jgi:predicted RNase H-like nuclease